MCHSFSLPLDLQSIPLFTTPRAIAKFNLLVFTFKTRIFYCFCSQFSDADSLETERDSSLFDNGYLRTPR